MVMVKNRLTKSDIRKIELLRDRVEILFNEIISLLEEASMIGD